MIYQTYAVTEPYISDHVRALIAQIDNFGDFARWEIAECTDLFGNDLSKDGTLTIAQRSHIDTYVAPFRES